MHTLALDISDTATIADVFSSHTMTEHHALAHLSRTEKAIAEKALAEVAIAETSLVGEASAFILKLFREKLSPVYTFHNPQHTLDVVEQACTIGKAYNLTDEEMETLLLAAWFHDSGYTEVYEGHEEASMMLAQTFLRKHDCQKNRIDAVCGCIQATEMPQQPQNLVEQILCDADISNIASDSFFDMSARLREEHRAIKGKTYTDAEWYDIKYHICKLHQFHTDYARRHFAPKQAENAAKLEQLKR